ncbi:hypothetical protein [Pantoea coffeiphila]|uniref:Uncharacterized protein n=1 Tax=Pantoea coffeiphila TaxID=1465635 RepID=A0A2S9I853_9GAMM|nr:hypothetical protein [Pantoea coffeiphila]PRD13956.1 hypothetical protein CQW29_18285 [Pantoea coffeiphila]
MTIEAQFPELANYLDPSDNYEIFTEEKQIGDGQYLIVTQRGENESDVMLFKIAPDGLQLQHDGVFAYRNNDIQPRSFHKNLVCGLGSPDDYQSLFNIAVQNVGTFSSLDGPDGGNLACCWAVRQLAYAALGRWITHTDSTTVFAEELGKCFNTTLALDNAPAGCIIISPTSIIGGKRYIGHVGVLGDGQGTSRLIYSNSSSHSRWEQNYSLESWIKRYHQAKGLPVYLYPIPSYEIAGAA